MDPINVRKGSRVAKQYSIQVSSRTSDTWRGLMLQLHVHVHLHCNFTPISVGKRTCTSEIEILSNDVLMEDGGDATLRSMQG